MKLESLKSSKFQALELNKFENAELVFGGRDRCTGGGFSYTGLVPDATGAQAVYKAWDSDVVSGGIGGALGGRISYYNQHSEWGNCSSSW
ncbi:MAG: hypothetical protein WC716_14140 [Chitinophagaceae bacterium]